MAPSHGGIRLKAPLVNHNRYGIEALETRTLLSNTILVDVNAPGPSHDGASWTTAYTDLQAALTAAVTGDEIHVADGTYKPTATTDRTISFQLKSGVKLYGGYAGFGAANPDVRSVGATPTILSGDIGTAGTKTDNSYHVIAASGTDINTLVDGFTITAGNANTLSTPTNRGGGVYISSGNVALNNCTFTSNS